MNKLFSHMLSGLIFLIISIQILIYNYNNKSSSNVFSQKNISVESFSSIILSNSGMTKIGSEKLNKIDERNIYLEGESFLENSKYKIYGNNISINMEDGVSSSDNKVKVINYNGVLEAQGFKNLDSEGKIFFKGNVTFRSHD